MDYEQIIANLQEVLLNQSRMLIDCQSRIRDLEAIIGVKQEIPDEVVYGYMDQVEDGRIIHSDLCENNKVEQITLHSNKKNKILLFTHQLNQLKKLKSIEIQFDQRTGYKNSIYLANQVEHDFAHENRISINDFRIFCFERGITVSFYERNRGFYPDWSTIFS
jgi:hypothetical protein